MIYFPNAKINIGLFVTNKREDGFHNIESIFYPIGLNDALEMRYVQKDKLFLDNNSMISENNPLTSRKNLTKLYLSGEGIEKDVSNDENNTVLKAFNLLKKDFRQISDVNICLDKRIPVFAGLGGGSADATFTLLLTNYMFNLGLNDEQLQYYASQIGSDCPFFLKNTPQFVFSRGEKMTSINLSLKNKYLVLIKPPLNISTKEAYKDVNKTPQPFDLRKLDVQDIKSWKDYVRNDFEIQLFRKYPILKEIKDTLYDMGALYSQMSGSGSTIFGIFEKETDLNRLNAFANAFVYQERLEK